MALRRSEQAAQVQSEGGRTGVRRTRTSRKGKDKGNGSKGEHGKKGGFGSKGPAQSTKSTNDEDEEEVNQQDVRKMVARMKVEDAEDERVQVAPNMRAGGSHHQAKSDSEEGDKRGTRRMKWADCGDEGGKEEEEQETEGEREDEAEGERDRTRGGDE